MSSLEELEGLKYRDLQKLAKEVGVKANLPKGQLVEEIWAKKSSDSSGETKKTPKSSREKAKLATPRFVEFTSEQENVTPLAGKMSPPTKNTPRRSTPKSSVEIISKPRSTPGKKSTPGGEKEVQTPKNRTPLRSRLVGTPASVSKNKNTPRKSPFLVHKVMKTPTHLVSATPKSQKKVSLMPKKTEPTTTTTTTQIPRFVPKKAPNFAKMHAQQFDKMDSLDVYLSKKKERTQQSMRKERRRMDLGNSVTKPARRSPRNHREEERETKKKVFAPSNLVANVKNFCFGVKSSSSPGKPFVFTASPRKTPVTKALANITNHKLNETPNSARKAFNLKESLAKPLGYKPHKGKLKSFAETKQEERRNMASKSASNKVGLKIKGVRMNKRAELLMANRKKNLA